MIFGQDFAFERVPEDQTISGWRLSIVLIGIVIALPAFVTGADIGFALGFRQGVLAILLGGVVLGAIAMATGTVGATTRLTTAMLTRTAFGVAGGRVVSGILALACLGWFGLTVEIFGKSFHQMVLNLGWNAGPAITYVLAGGVLMVGTTLFGFAALQRLSGITVPLLALLIGYTAIVTMRSASTQLFAVVGDGPGGVGDGASAIIGSLAVAVTIFPDLCRFSRSVTDARLCAFLTYMVAMPAILTLAIIPSIATHQRDVIAIMAGLGLGVPALLLLVIKAWATNSGNLYVASLSAANMLSSNRQKRIVTVGGAVGIAFGAAGIVDRIMPFLVALSVCIPPIAGIYVVDFIVRSRAYDETRDQPATVRWPAIASLVFGIATAVAARTGLLTFTGISAIDSMLCAAGAYYFLFLLKVFAGDPHSSPTSGR